MEEEEKKIHNLQKKSHETLLKLLNNIGIVGSALAGAADIIFVIIFVVGVKVDIEIKSAIIFACINAGIGLLINILLRYQGQKYAEIENEALCAKFHKKKVKKNKRHLSMEAWQALKSFQDIIVKGCTTAFSICGIIYISIEGSKNPIQILITFVTLILFTCFGLISMNSSYCRFYNVQVPYMELKVAEEEKNKFEIKKEGEKENGVN